MVQVFCIEPPVYTRTGNTDVSVGNETERRRLITVLNTQLSHRFGDAIDEAMSDLCCLLKRKDDLVRSTQSVSDHIRARASQLERTQSHQQSLNERRLSLTRWQAVSTPHHSDPSNDCNEHQQQHTSPSVDHVLQYTDILDNQMCTCFAQDGAFADALDQLDEAFVKGVIDQDAYMKHVRDVSRQQFFPRALRKKIEIAKSKKLEVDEHGQLRPMRTGRAAPLFAS